MSLLSRPDLLWVHLVLWLKYSAGAQVLWGFDVLAAFAVTFALVYGLYVFSGALFPTAFGRRPRVWRIPAVFAVSLAAFYLFMDDVVTPALRQMVGFCANFFVSLDWLIANCCAVLAVIWLMGFGFAFFRLMRAVMELRRPAGEPAPEPLRAAMAASGLKRRVDLRVGGADSPVASYGVFRPVILIPSGFAERFSPEEQYAMYLHECVHIRRHDVATLFCMHLVKCVFWFDPIMKHALQRMKVDMELLCDWTLVHVHRLDSAGYASLIVKAATRKRGHAVGFSHGYRQIAQRLGHILNDSDLPTPSRLSRGKAFAGALGLLLLLAFGVAAASAPDVLPAYTVRQETDQSIRAGEDITITTQVISRHGVFSSFAYARSVAEKK